MPITANQLLKFRKIPCYKCYDPIKENLPNEDLAWDNFQTVYSELDSVYETPNATNYNHSASVGQGNTHPNSFGTLTNLARQLGDPSDPYIEQLLETKNISRNSYKKCLVRGRVMKKGNENFPSPQH